MLKNPPTNENRQLPKKRISQLPPITQPQSTKILNLSNILLTQDEINILKLGLSFTPTPK